MKELKFEELTLRQKLGMVYTAFLNSWVKSEDNEEFIFELIKERALGAVWIQQGYRDAEKMLAKVKELADYPIIIMTDAESGVKTEKEKYIIGNHTAISRTGDLKYAYAFGKVSGTIAHKLGYNMICAPILDLVKGHTRALGSDKEKVATIATSVAQGYHDGGVLTMGKHYPGGNNIMALDSHMTPSICDNTKEEFIEKYLYPYRKLMEKGLLDGIMTGHKKCLKIDPDRPASMSKKVIDIIRELGFDGFALTDALIMYGVRGVFTDVEAKGYAIAAGNDSILPFTANSRNDFAELCKAYEDGLIPDEALDAAVRRVLATQHKTLLLPDDAEITEEELENFRNIDRKSVYEKTDEGIPASLSKDGKYLFAVMIKNSTQFNSDGKIDVDTFTNSWYNPIRIEEKIKELFPNSKLRYFYEFPEAWQNRKILEESLGCDETIFVTFAEGPGFTGPAHFTHRAVTLAKAMRLNNRLSTVLYFGRPNVLEELPHVPRLIVGVTSENGIESAFEVLAGMYPAEGTLVDNFNFT